MLTVTNYFHWKIGRWPIFRRVDSEYDARENVFFEGNARVLLFFQRFNIPHMAIGARKRKILKQFLNLFSQVNPRNIEKILENLKGLWTLIAENSTFLLLEYFKRVYAALPPPKKKGPRSAILFNTGTMTTFATLCTKMYPIYLETYFLGWFLWIC